MTDTQQPQSQIIEESTSSLWGLSLQAAGCAHCGQAFLVAKNRTELLCPNCAQSSLQPQPARLRREPPERVIPFQIQHAGLKTIFSRFVEGVWLRHDDFETETLLKRSVPLFVPMWLVDSDVSGTWQAEMGFDYQVKSSQEHYGGSGWQTRDVIEKRSRWEPRLGQVDLHYDNAITPALNDHRQLVEQVGEYVWKSARPYDAALLGNAVLRIPDLQTGQAWPQAKDALEKRLAQDCQKAAEAQHLRRFSASLEYANQNWTQLLLPLYFSWYSDDEGTRYPVYINAQSGKIGGIRLASQRKGWKWAGITAAIAVMIFLLGLLCFALGALLPILAVIGTVLTILALLTGAGAIIPAVWPWQWNRRQLDIKIRTSG